MFSHSFQGQESNGYFFKKKELPIQLYVAKAEGEKIKNVKLNLYYVTRSVKHAHNISSVTSDLPQGAALPSQTPSLY